MVGELRRARVPVLGGDVVSADQHRGRSAVRKIRRSLRPQGRPAGGGRGVPAGLRALRHRAGHAAADLASRRAGHRRRRADGGHHRRDRRRHPAARARALPGILRRGVRLRDHRRPAARRLLRRSPELAIDLLHQPAARGAGDDRDRRGSAVRGGPPPPRHRLCRRAHAHRRAQRRHPVRRPRRHHLRLDVARHPRPDRGEPRLHRRLHRRRAAGARTDPAAEPVRRPQLRRRQRRRPDRRPLDVRSGDVPSGLPAGGEGREPVDLRRHAHADDARHADHLGGQRPPDQPLRPLQALSRPRHRRS